MSDEVNETSETSAAIPEKRGRGRPPKNPEPVGATPGAEPPEVPQVAPVAPAPSLRARAVALLTPSRGRQALSPDQLAKEADERARHLVASLEAFRGGYQQMTDDMVRQYEFELWHYQNGTWRPGLRAPKGAGQRVYENIAGGPRMPGRDAVPDNPSLDVTLEEAGDGAPGV